MSLLAEDGRIRLKQWKVSERVELEAEQTDLFANGGEIVNRRNSQIARESVSRSRRSVEERRELENYLSEAWQRAMRLTEALYAHAPAGGQIQPSQRGSGRGRAPRPSCLACI